MYTLYIVVLSVVAGYSIWNFRGLDYFGKNVVAIVVSFVVAQFVLYTVELDHMSDSLFMRFKMLVLAGLFGLTYWEALRQNVALSRFVAALFLLLVIWIGFYTLILFSHSGIPSFSYQLFALATILAALLSFKEMLITHPTDRLATHALFWFSSFNLIYFCATFYFRSIPMSEFTSSGKAGEIWSEWLPLLFNTFLMAGYAICIRKSLQKTAIADEYDR